MMTHRHIDLAAIEASLELAAERGGDITALVYRRLFSSHPELEAMFCLDTDGAVRGSMLARAVEVLLDLGGERQFAEGFVRAEAINHAATHGTAPELFADFYGVLADTVRELVGQDWTAAMAAAWQAALGDIRACAGPGAAAG